MNLKTAQRNYDAQSPAESTEILEDLERTYLAISHKSDTLLDEIALYLCNGRDSYAKERLLRRIEKICDDAIEQALERDRKADANAREGA
jgi:hypothetical protein